MKIRLLFLALLGVIWLLPFYCVGSMFGLPFKVPSLLYTQYASGGLFTRRVGSWSQMLVQVRSVNGPDWQTIDISRLSPMEVFGYRHRLERVGIVTSKNRTLTERVRLRLAEWVEREHAKRHPEAAEITGVRFVQTSHATNQPEMAVPQGRWQRDTLALEPKPALQVLATFIIQAEKVQVERAVRPAAVPAAPSTPKVFERKRKSEEGAKEGAGR